MAAIAACRELPVAPPPLVARLVMARLDVLDLLACTTVCKGWTAMADDELVRHKIRVRMNGHPPKSVAMCMRKGLLTERCVNRRWANAEWLDIVFHRCKNHDIKLLNVELPRVRRLALWNAWIDARTPPPCALLASPQLRHLLLSLTIDVSNRQTVMARVHDVLRACGKRLHTLSLTRNVPEYMRLKRHDNMEDVAAEYGWPELPMPCLDRLRLCSAFSWLALDAPCVTFAEVCEGPHCMQRGDVVPVITRALSKAATTLRDLTWIVRHDVPGRVWKQVAPRLALFLGLERLRVVGYQFEFVTHRLPATAKATTLQLNDIGTIDIKMVFDPPPTRSGLPIWDAVELHMDNRPHRTLDNTLIKHVARTVKLCGQPQTDRWFEPA